MKSFRNFISNFIFEEYDDSSFQTAEHLRQYFHEKYPGIDIQFHDNKNQKHSSLSMIQVPKAYQRRGIGNEVMNAIGKYADSHGHTVGLTPEKRPGAGGPSKAQLESWYKGHGYVMNRGRNIDYRFSDSMIRNPKK